MSDETDPRRHLAFPLDYPELESARRGAELVCGSAGVLKVGLELFVREGPTAARIGEEFGCEVFLDLKLHDIPATVDGAVASAASLGVRYITVHASGGERMVEAAAERATREGGGLVVLAVTVLTSLDQNDLDSMGVAGPAEAHVLRLARLARSAGARGFVCSPAEVGLLRKELGPDAVLVTPGIRTGQSEDDQKRVATPADAIRSGSNLLVVGRPIRDASDPTAAASAVLQEIREAMGERANT